LASQRAQSRLLTFLALTARRSQPPRPEAEPCPTLITWPSSTPCGERNGSSASQPIPPDRAGRVAAEYAADGLTSPQATRLWRTLRAAEAAGPDSIGVVCEVVSARSLTGARDIASVIDSRIRNHVGPLVPQPPRPWSEPVPDVADPERHQFLTELAAAMDARKDASAST
jgi:hypothetical protein